MILFSSSVSYPVVTMGKITHPGSRNYHIGAFASQEYVDLTSIEQQVTDQYPPTFLWWGDADETVDPENSRMLQQALEAHHIPHQYREYAGVGHGVGIGERLPCEGWFEGAVAFWESHRNA